MSFSFDYLCTHRHRHFKRLLIVQNLPKTAQADWSVALGCWSTKNNMAAISHSAHLP